MFSLSPFLFYFPSLIFPPHLSCICLISPVLFPEFRLPSTPALQLPHQPFPPPAFSFFPFISLTCVSTAHSTCISSPCLVWFVSKAVLFLQSLLVRLFSLCYPAVQFPPLFACSWYFHDHIKPHPMHFLPAVSCIWVYLLCVAMTSSVYNELGMSLKSTFLANGNLKYEM